MSLFHLNQQLWAKQTSSGIALIRFSRYNDASSAGNLIEISNAADSAVIAYLDDRGSAVLTGLVVGSGAVPTGTADVKVVNDMRVGGTIYASDFVLTGGSGSGSGLTLDNLDDVIITSPVSGQVIRYNGSSFVNATLSYSDISGSPPTNGSGTSGTLAMWSGSATLGDSLISQSGGTLAIGGNLAMGAATTLTLAAGTATVAALKFQASTLLTTQTFGAVEFDGTKLYLTNNSSSPTRKTVAFIDSVMTGTWNGAAITGAYGGTGVNNGTKTITLGGNLTTSGAFNLTLTLTGTTTVTLPTSGTLVNTAVTSLSSLSAVGTISAGAWNASAILPAYGGTGLTSYALGDLLYASAANVLAALAGNITTTGKFLKQTGTGTVSAAPSWQTLVAGDIPSLDASKLTSGTLGVARGGTGTSSAPANGQLLIGNGSGYTLATLVGGAGITVTNAAGAITIAKSALSSVTLNATGGADLIVQNMVAGVNEPEVGQRTAYDTSDMVQGRVVVVVNAAGSASAELGVQYSTDGGTTWKNPVDDSASTSLPSGALKVTIASAGVKIGSWVNLHANAKTASAIWRWVTASGDGTADPALGNIYVQFK